MKSQTNETETQLRRLYRQVPNFNLVPPEYQKPAIFSRRFLLRLLVIAIVAAELFAIWNLYQEKSSLEADIASAQLQIQHTEDKVATVNAEKELKKERQALQDDWETLTMGQADWPQILSAFLKSKPEGVELSSLKQEAGLINANGTASNYASLLQYRSTLLGSPAISQIVSFNSRVSDGSISFSLSVEIAGGGR
ncbi:MAG: hypothetical protein V1932_04035 [Chloroflexota bacterium]